MYKYILSYHNSVIMDLVIVDQTPENKKDNQIFKTPVPIQFLWNFLKENFAETDTHFQVTAYLFHKTEYNQHLEGFITFLRPYYHNTKRKYIDRQLKYKGFLTIIRQLCNTFQVKYSIKLVYNKSTYEIEYRICKC